MTFEARTEHQAGATIVTFTGDLDIASEADAALTGGEPPPRDAG